MPDSGEPSHFWWRSQAKRVSGGWQATGRAPRLSHLSDSVSTQLPGPFLRVHRTEGTQADLPALVWTSPRIPSFYHSLSSNWFAARTVRILVWGEVRAQAGNLVDRSGGKESARRSDFQRCSSGMVALS